MQSKYLLFILAPLLCALASATDKLGCLKESDTVWMVEVQTGKRLSEFAAWTQCELAREASNGSVVCTFLTPDDPVGPGGWKEYGWRPTHISSGVGLGRRPAMDFDSCLTLTENANGKIVCTNTGVGYKPTHIESNLWCGSSSLFQYCIQASKASVNNRTCSFPTSGSGAEAGWVTTVIADTCEYNGNKKLITQCVSEIR